MLDRPGRAAGRGRRTAAARHLPLAVGAKEVDLSPALHFIRAQQVAELSPSDAAALGINEGDRVEVGNGTRVPATVRLRAAVPAGSVFLAEGTPSTTRTCSTHGTRRRPPRRPGLRRAVVDPVQSQPAVEGLAEMPPSAPLPIPPREVT